MLKITSNRPAQFDFDLICIGSGAGGGLAAALAAKNGQRVALIEKASWGGESPNYSCIPVNAYLNIVKKIDSIKESFEMGVETGRINLNWQKAFAYKNKCVENTGVLESTEALAQAGINLFEGVAKFVDPWTIDIGHQQIKAPNIIIATGTTDFIPKITGLKKSNFITFKDAFDLPSPPSSLFIIGGGSTGCSMAEIFNAFDSRVYIAEAGNNLLQREDVEVGQVEAEILKNKGVHVMLNSQILKINNISDLQNEVVIKEDGQLKNIIVEKILVAAGKLPQVDLNLAAAKVQFDGFGIKVNHYLETSMNHIYAVGDVTGHDMLTHLANYHSRLVIHNLSQSKNKNKISLNYSSIPRYLALSPEIAATGLTEIELKQKQVAYKKAIVPLHGLERSSLSNQQSGFVKLICTPNRKLLGGSIIAPCAGEMIAQLTLAVNSGLSVDDFKNNIKAFTTWSEAFNLVCQKIK